MEIVDFEIFKGKKLTDLFKEIHKNSTKKADQIDILIGELQKLVNTPSDALMIVPMIKEYLDIGVKNDEALIKLAVVVQRIISSAKEGGSEDMVLSDSERQQLLDAAREAASNDTIKALTNKTDQLKKDIEDKSVEVSSEEIKS